MSSYGFDPSIDDDIFTPDDEGESSGPDHGSDQHDSRSCPACQAVNSVPGSYSNQTREQASQILHQIVGGANVQTVEESEMHSPLFEAVQNLLIHDFKSQISSATWVCLRAVVDTLDELTEGRATLRWTAYRYERHLWAAHMSVRSFEELLDMTKEHEAEADQSDADRMERFAQTRNMLTFMIEIIMERIPFLTNEYERACEQAKIEPRTDIIESGEYDEDVEDIPEILRMITHQIQISAEDTDLDRE